jgi:hypothetical protein
MSESWDQAYMHDLHIKDSDIRAGYAFPRGPGLPHSGVLASKRGKETQDYRGEMNVWVGATSRMLGTFISPL